MRTKWLNRLGVLALVTGTLVVLWFAAIENGGAPAGAQAPTPTPTPGYTLNWNGQTPATPAVWVPPAVSTPSSTSNGPVDMIEVNSRQSIDDRMDVSGGTYYTAAVGHGSDCSAPPNQHTIDTYANSIYVCAAHLMSGFGDSYGAFYGTLPVEADWTNGPVTISWRVSSLSRSSRDWWDVTIQPWDEQHSGIGNQSDRPADFIQAVVLNGAQISSMNYNWVPTAGMTRGGVDDNVPADTNTDMHYLFTNAVPAVDMSEMRRDLFQLTISSTHLKLCAPEYNQCWVDANYPNGAISWTHGVINFDHRSYNPDKACEDVMGHWDGTCHPNTWHWSDFSVVGARPFTLWLARPGMTGKLSASDTTFNFPTGSPSGAHLRYLGTGSSLQHSYDGGTTWLNGNLQPGSLQNDYDYRSYWDTIPTGTTSVRFRATDSLNGAWHVRGVAVYSR